MSLSSSSNGFSNKENKEELFEETLKSDDDLWILAFDLNANSANIKSRQRSFLIREERERESTKPWKGEGNKIGMIENELLSKKGYHRNLFENAIAQIKHLTRRVRESSHKNERLPGHPRD